MKHKIGFNRLDRNASHRKALHRNMVTSLFTYERVKTTKAKALEIRRTAEKMITRAKEDNVHNRRIVMRRLYDEGTLAKLFTNIAPRMKERNGGYTRIIKLGARAHDAAEMVILELVDFKLEENTKKDEKKADSKAAAPKETKVEPKAKAPAKPKAPAKAKASASGETAEKKPAAKAKKTAAKADETK